MQYSFKQGDSEAYVDLSGSIGDLDGSDYEVAVLDLVDRKDSIETGQRFDLYYAQVAVSEGKAGGRTIHPLLLYPYRITEGDIGIDWGMPVVNGAAVSYLDSLDLKDATIEAEELTRGIRGYLSDGGKKGSGLDWLADNKTDWNLKKALSREVPVFEISRPGVYGVHFLCLVEQSPYTAGLEHELTMLPNLPDVEDSALQYLLSGSSDGLSVDTGIDILSVLPSNREQSQAVQSALSDKISVIQGPPGTGKSQVIAQTIINAVHNNQTVLFVSKNNQAVDVVERRVNELSRRPLVMRLGSGSILRQVSTYLNSHLSPPEVRESSYLKILRVIERLKSREGKYSRHIKQYFNDRDWLIESSEVKNLDSRKYREVPSFLLNRIAYLDGRVQGGDTEGFVDKIASLELKACLHLMKFRYMESGGVNHDISLIEAELLFRKRASLVEGLSRDSLVSRVSSHARLKQKINMHTKGYWSAYMSTRSSRFSQDTKQRLVEFKARVGLSGGGNNESLETLLEGIYSLDVSPLPAWSTTLLSLRRTTPFKAGMFDLVIFDESSQCDIASALPALARAKKAVVIGDPKQLSHITPHTADHERALLQSYGLTGKDMKWSYTQNSLFDLFQSTVRLSSINLLKDHHRSHPDIIEFSNRYFYGQMLKYKTDESLLKVEKGCRGVSWDDTGGSRVERPSSGSLRNVKEAMRVVRVLQGLILSHEGASIGIITPFRAQANYIGDLIESELGQDYTERFDIRVGTVHTFQGDEKDIILFSPVVAEGMTTGQVKFISQAGNIFNVAITRARSTLIVVGDLLFARTNHVPFYSQFVDYIYTHDFKRRNSSQGSVDSSDIKFSGLMEVLVGIVEGELGEIPLAASKVAVSSDIKGFEVVKLEVGDKSIGLLLDSMTEIGFDESYQSLIDTVEGLVEDSEVVISTFKEEVADNLDALKFRIRHEFTKVNF